jgi:hypothetical protein
VLTHPFPVKNASFEHPSQCDIDIMDTTEFEKVLKRQKFITQEANSTLEKMILAVQQVQSQLTRDEPPVTVKETLGKMKDWSNKVLDSHKDFQATLQKYSKNIDKKFKIDLNSVWNPKAFEGKADLLHEALATHFVREGFFDLETTFEEESGIALPQDFKKQFTEMFTIQSALKLGNLDPAIQWTQRHGAQLAKNGSALEFQLHRLRYIQLLKSGDIDVCLKYAKEYLGSFSREHLSGSLSQKRTLKKA